jgi:hypothetical protein
VVVCIGDEYLGVSRLYQTQSSDDSGLQQRKVLEEAHWACLARSALRQTGTPLRLRLALVHPENSFRLLRNTMWGASLVAMLGFESSARYRTSFSKAILPCVNGR